MPTSAGASRGASGGGGYLRAFVVTSAALLSLLDFAGLLFAGLSTAWLSARGSTPGEVPDIGEGVHYLLIVTALLAAIVLHDQQFGERAGRGHWSALARCYCTRFLLFSVGVWVIGSASGVLGTIPSLGVTVWLGLSVMLTSTLRAALAGSIRWLTHEGVLTEIVAIVGAGSLAARLERDPVNGKRTSMRVIGVFDDRNPLRNGPEALAGTVDDLIELGKTRHLDWIFINLPSADVQRLMSVVRRLKALAVPIALCPRNVGLGTPYQRIDYIGGTLPVTVLVDRQTRRGRSAVRAACKFLPRWVTTLLLLPTFWRQL